MAPPALTQIAEFFRRLTAAQVVAMFLLILSVGGFIFGLVYFMNRVEFQALYANVSPEDANAVVERLKEQKVPYRLEDGGRTVKVPADRVDEIRILLAGSGMQLGGVGFEIFDKTSFGMTDFVQQVNYRRALEGELARTVTSLSEVSQARVHLVLPKETLFATEEGEGKASIVVKLKMGKALTQSAVSGIVNLVASSVDGLRPENVAVLDAYGRLLSKPSSGDAAEMLTESQNRMKAEVERQMNSKILSILEPIVGEGRVRANVSAELDLEKVEETEERFDPATTVVRSQQKNSESSGPAGQGGPPGTQSNQPQGTTVASSQAGGAQSFTRTSELTNYEVSKVVRHRVDPYGTIKKVSAAVIVDDMLKIETDEDGATKETFVTRTPEDLKKYRDVVAAAIGIDTARGDLLTIENLSFGVRQELTPEAPPSFLSRYSGYILPVVKYVAFILLFLLVYSLVIKPMVGRVYTDVLGAAPRGSGEQLMLPHGGHGALHGGAAAAAIAAGQGGPLPRTVGDIEAELETEIESELPLPTKEARKGTVIKKKVVEAIKKEPVNAGQLIKTWLAEEKSGKRRA